MVKPITKETLFMNCLEMDFATKAELELWVETHEQRVIPLSAAEPVYTIRTRAGCTRVG